MGDINQDPSMEEILASIKRVIADDSRAAAPPRGSARPRLHVPEEPEPEPESAAKPEAELEAEEDDVLELSNPIREDDGLASSDATVAARQSLAALAAMRQAAPPPQPNQPPIGDGPLEAIVREMLRPMLKDWLDNRLPEMVEEMVAREIARITGKSF